MVLCNSFSISTCHMLSLFLIIWLLCTMVLYLI
jgi:hypothetical protein